MADRSSRLLLVTGMSGLIGGLAGRALAQRYPVRALNRKAVSGVDCVRADIRDLAAIRPAFEGVHTVVHLAAYLGKDDESQLNTNITGTYNVFRAAAEAGVQRVVFASSGATVGGYEADMPYTAMVEGRWQDVPEQVPMVDHQLPVRPVGLYGAAKVFGEALGRSYADRGELSVICTRIGRVTQDDKPHNAREAAVYLSHRDVVQAIERAVDAPDELRFVTFFAVSANRGRYRDLEHARETVGFVPVDGAE